LFDSPDCDYQLIVGRRQGKPLYYATSVTGDQLKVELRPAAMEALCGVFRFFTQPEAPAVSPADRTVSARRKAISCQMRELFGNFSFSGDCPSEIVEAGFPLAKVEWRGTNFWRDVSLDDVPFPVVRSCERRQ